MRIIFKGEEEARTKEVEELKREITSKIKRVSELNCTIDSLEYEKKIKKAKIEDLEETIKQLHSQIEYKEQKIKDSTNTLETYKKDVESQEKHYLEQIEELKELNRKYAGEKGGLTKENHKLKARIEELNQNIKNMSEELTKGRIQPTPTEFGNRYKYRKNKDK